MSNGTKITRALIKRFILFSICAGIRIKYGQKKNRGLSPLFLLSCSKRTNYAATAGATRATGRDSPAARSRGKL